MWCSLNYILQSETLWWDLHRSTNGRARCVAYVDRHVLRWVYFTYFACFWLAICSVIGCLVYNSLWHQVGNASHPIWESFMRSSLIPHGSQSVVCYMAPRSFNNPSSLGNIELFKVGLGYPRSHHKDFHRRCVMHDTATFLNNIIIWGWPASGNAPCRHSSWVPEPCTSHFLLQQGSFKMAISEEQFHVLGHMEIATSTISFVCTFLMIASFFYFRRLRTPANTLIVYASASNVFANMATVMGTGHSARNRGVRCQTQAFLIEW